MLSVCEFNQQKSAAKVFRHRNEGGFLGSNIPVFEDRIVFVTFNLAPVSITRLLVSTTKLRWPMLLSLYFYSLAARPGAYGFM